jgi:hypothetical protein
MITRLTCLVLACLMAGQMAFALDITDNAYAPVQWIPPAPPPPGVYMPIPPPPRPDYYEEWRRWGGHQVPYPQPPGPNNPRLCRDVYGRLFRC